MLAEKKELETLMYLQDIIESYEEIASIRMQKVKRSVLANRSFLDGLRRLAQIVRHSYKREIARIQKRKKTNIIRKTNGKTVAVLLSANTGLYGEIVQKTYNKFYKYVSDNDTDIVIVGKIGYRMFESSGLNRSAEYYELSDSFTDKENIERLLKYIVDYETIIIFHGKFKDMLVQEPEIITITGEEVQRETNEDVAEVEYIFEPSLENVMAYFEQEILGSMFKHAIHESSLSKYASRMISLDRATERIHETIGDYKLQYQKQKHRMQNKKQQNILAGIYGRITHA